MAGKLMGLGMCGWLALMVLATGEELSTVAYVVDRGGFEELSREWHWQDGDNRDPLAEEPEEKFVAPMRLEKKPNGIRFFADGDRMWLLTGTFLQQDILTNERSWAVWNEDRSRLVVHGTQREHGWVAMLWDVLIHVWQVETSVELVKVRCRELEGVEWTPEEVKKRGGEVLHEIAMTARPGQKGHAELMGEAGLVRLETEGVFGSDLDVIDVQFSYEAAVEHPDGLRNLEVSTGMTLYAGHRVYVEVGGADQPGETYLLGVKTFPKFMDGTPSWRWREFEDKSVQAEPPEPSTDSWHRVALDDGKVLIRAPVWPTMVEDLSEGPGGDDVDPFAPDAGLEPGLEALRERMEAKGVGPVAVRPDVPGFLRTDRLIDVTGLMKQVGLRMPEGTWIYFNKSRSSVVGTMTPSDVDLLEALLSSVLYCGDPKMLRVTASLIEWEGELQPGRIPKGARRLARMGAVARPGQKVTVRHGWPVEELKRGGYLEVEPNIGASNRIIDMRLEFRVAGERKVRMSTALTLGRGEPVVIPVGEDGGKKLGVVLECQVIDGVGEEMRP